MCTQAETDRVNALSLIEGELGFVLVKRQNVPREILDSIGFRGPCSNDEFERYKTLLERHGEDASTLNQNTWEKHVCDNKLIEKMRDKARQRGKPKEYIPPINGTEFMEVVEDESNPTPRSTRPPPGTTYTNRASVLRKPGTLCVTNSNAGPHSGPRLFYTYPSIPVTRHRASMSSSKAANGTTTTLPSAQNVGNMNLKLFPSARRRHLHDRPLAPRHLRDNLLLQPPELGRRLQHLLQLA
ncbi:hypothetical protein EDB81DRAFT_768518 [Dactylonectria macrodidyma]|uniref:Uncharacterized protein n=1 Tax=Dactylonectria macrodidyma TaxID=307937 RepID=A0A9P9D1A9_9HYPO|nr:hypothetical protein EDB81DRAFT_768518 [Dactylonectria macrodidyma]